ncbi:MAG: hypothetical protein DRP09_12955 [Candidatus Thorarchaeota archaeon]|nr:MAG: hypothetical protein DRP09_12955 [Candidatus Thorarchaeota archaeon]
MVDKISYKILKIVENEPGIYVMAICRRLNNADFQTCLAQRTRKVHKGRWRNLECKCEIKYTQVLYRVRKLEKNGYVITRKEYRPDLNNPYRKDGLDLFLCVYPKRKLFR